MYVAKYAVVILTAMICFQVRNAVQTVRNNGWFTGDGITNIARRMLEVGRQLEMRNFDVMMLLITVFYCIVCIRSNANIAVAEIVLWIA